MDPTLGPHQGPPPPPGCIQSPVTKITSIHVDPMPRY